MRIILSLLTGIALLAAIVSANGHTGATGIVKERMMAMKAIAGAMKQIANVDWSDRDRAQNIIGQQSQVLQGHAAKIVEQFPEGSIEGPSEATPAIWVNPERFAAIAKELEDSAAALSAAATNANSKSDIAAPFKEIGGTCKSCHAEFRKKK